MKKRIVSLFLGILFALNCSVPTFAAETASFSLTTDSNHVNVGDALCVTVNMKKNPGIVSFQMDVLFDTDVLTCTSIDVGSVFSQDGAIFDSNENNRGKASFAAISSDPMTGDGSLATLTFLAKKAGNCTLSTELVYMETEASEISGTDTAITVTVSDRIESGKEEIIIPEVVTPAKPPVTISFTDVPTTHWAYTYIQNAVKNGLFSGIGNGQFGPGMNVTRGMFVTTLYSSAGSPDVKLSNFTDVPANAWYAKAVAWASQQGIVSGIGNNKFGPDMPITREQIALILFNYADGVSPGSEAFVRMLYSDAKDIHDWALSAFTWALSEKLIAGKAGDLLDPLATASRAEVAVIMQNFVNLTK